MEPGVVSVAELISNPTSFPISRTCQVKKGKGQRVTVLQRSQLMKKGKAVYLHDVCDQNHINVNAGIGELFKTAAGIEQGSVMSLSGKAAHHFRAHKQNPSNDRS